MRTSDERVGRGERSDARHPPHHAVGHRRHAPHPDLRGFSLIELIVVMVVVGLLAAIVAGFITSPVQAYLGMARRAELVDIADTALLRIARDVRLALPNSLRVTQVGSVWYLEYLPVVDGGRYRAAQDGSVTCLTYPDDTSATPVKGCNILDFAAVKDPVTNLVKDSSFDVLGPPVKATSGNYLVIYNTGNAGSSTDAWKGDNRRTVTSTGTVATLAFTPTSLPFPFSSEPAYRFFVTDLPVTYVCDPNAQTIRRYSGTGYTPSLTQPTSFGATVPSALLATHVSGCAFTYNPGASQRLGQLSLGIQLTGTDSSGSTETVALYREVAVNNEP